MFGSKITQNEKIITLLITTIVLTLNYSCNNSPAVPFKPKCIKDTTFILGSFIHQVDLKELDFRNAINTLPLEKGGSVFFRMKDGPYYNPYNHSYYQSIHETTWLYFNKSGLLTEISFSYTYSIGRLGSVGDKKVNDFIEAIRKHEIHCLTENTFNHNNKIVKEHKNYIEEFHLIIEGDKFPTLKYSAKLK